MQYSPLDTVKLAISLTILVGGLVAFYHYADASKLFRVGGSIATVIVAVAIAFQTDKGRQVSSFIRDAQIEVRKVVWPTRQWGKGFVFPRNATSTATASWKAPSVELSTR